MGISALGGEEKASCLDVGNIYDAKAYYTAPSTWPQLGPPAAACPNKVKFAREFVISTFQENCASARQGVRIKQSPGSHRRNGFTTWHRIQRRMKNKMKNDTHGNRTGRTGDTILG